ncbi:MAG: SPOR domain-containing protein [Paucibacter sp.]|nr:SPOR domain-containing protein [Roseateles sp.]
MGLLSFFKRKSDAPAAKPVADKADAVQVLRVRARHRLIGAAVLVAVGVIGFPLIFATQPRPLPVNLPIDIPKKDGAPPLAVPAEVQAAPDAAPPSSAAATDTPEAPAASTPTQAKAAQVATPQPAPVVPVPAAVEPKADANAPQQAKAKADAPKPEPTHAAAVTKSTARDAGDAARAQALLDGKTPASAAPSNQASDKGRFIVQVGAFSDLKAAHDVRAKVEHLGLKTYTQAVDTSTGKRIRVRVGPFPNRTDAQQAAAKLKNSGLAADVLTL